MSEVASVAKRALRAELLARRVQLAATRSPGSSEQLAAHLARYLDTRPHLGVIAGYLPIRGELDLCPALLRAQRMGCVVVLPRVEPDGERVVFAPVSRLEEQVRPTRWGLREPWGEPLALERIDLMLVPGLAFDHGGHRLGFGKGHYDRVVQRLRGAARAGEARVWGVCDRAMLCEAPLPSQPHDQRVDGVLTPDGVISFV